MANNKIDIPGFIRDPETGRYFRENPADMGNSSLKKIKLEVKAKTAPKVRPSKIKNVSNFLRMRDIGSFNGVVAESEYCKMMVKNKKEVFSEKMNVTLNLDEQCSMESVEFIIGSEKANIGLWNHKIGSQHKYIVMERNFFNAQDHRSMNYKTTKYNIIDMCEAPNDILVCIYNNFVHNTTSIHCFAKHYEDDSLIFRKGAFYCCSAVGNGIAYAAGGENCIKLFNVNDVDESLHLKGRVHTLSSDKDGKLLAAGLHDGRIRLYDVTTKKVTTEIKGLDTCIVESAFRESTPYAIFAGLPDKLFEVSALTLLESQNKQYEICH